MLTYFATILGGVIFGILQMKETENFWTREYERYVAEQEIIATQTQNEEPVVEETTEGENI